jgi:ketosteroid isomerase-like protein
MSDATRKAVEGYFHAWTTKKVAEAHAWLAKDLKFRGPTARYESADAFLPALEKFAAMTKSATLLELIVEGDRAAMLYDCDLAPIGTLRIASFFHVKDGKITTYETWFDATELRKLAARAGN